MRTVPTMLCWMTALAVSAPLTAQRQPSPLPAVAPAPRYAVIANLVLASPVIVDGVIRSTARIKGAEATGLTPGSTRFYVEAEVLALIRGAQPLPARIGYLLDVTPDSRGRLPNLKKLRVLLFARGVAGNIGQVQLVRPDAQSPWTPAADELTRRITTEIVAQTAPPEMTGIGNAFHTSGALPGEGETQIFLTTPDNRPVSLTIVRRGGERPRWSISLGDVVGEGVPPPPRDTLLWYRLACSLPPALPDSVLSGVDGPDAAVAREDYRFVVDSLGTCDRRPA